MLELRLRSGQVVAFDGRVLEVFAEREPSRRFHVAHIGETDPIETAAGGRTLALDGGVTLAFAREETPTCARLVAVIAEARAACERLDAG